ncbi:guanylate kinase-associated protein mars [Contarinia nasturtii]|uniref:guanylate kinase-associated protein mars n=1 Tax=Contarinia nasturtii TaxID=265458 RepID=UPI0012D48E5D|nr:guanylate kinase-associated protein mars [Contarinia nasturtii]
MNASEHSILFKSKSGRHIGISSNQNQDRKATSQYRSDKRHAAYSRNRIIESTPGKPFDAVPLADDNGNEHSNEPKLSVVPPSDKDSISRKKAYRDKFKEYLEKKANEKRAKAKSKPFLCAVASGRFVAVNNEKNKSETKQKNVAKEPESIIPQCFTPRYSPINTRSKKLALLSPKDQTPKRKSRNAKSSEKLPKFEMKRRVPITTKFKTTNSIKKTVATVSSSSTKKTITAAPTIAIKKTVSSAPTIAIKKTTVKVSSAPAKAQIKKFDAPTTTQGLPNVKPTEPLNQRFLNMKKVAAAKSSHGKIGAVHKFIKPNVNTKSTDSESSVNNNWMTSTVVKLKHKPQTAVSKKKLNIFNDSISPIEDVLVDSKVDLVKPLTPKQVRKLKSETPVVGKKVSPFVSPFVVIKKGVNIQTTPVNAQKSDELCVTPKSSHDAAPAVTNYVSPYVTIGRGRYSSGRKEKEAREKKYTLESRKSLDLNQSVEERQNKEAALYFHQQVAKETDHFRELITEWQEYSKEHPIPSEYKDLVDVAVGQTQLLITNKFKQFSNLIRSCENNDGDKPIKPEDLEGFWSMMYIQVEQLNQRFERLKMLKENNWEDPAINVSKQKKIRPDNAMVAKFKPAKKRVNSALAAMLKEARKKYNESKENKEMSNQINDVVFMKKRLSSAKSTPQKTPWIVEDCVVNQVQTPARSILKTPGSIRKKRMTLTFKRSPQVKVFEKEDGSIPSSFELHENE